MTTPKRPTKRPVEKTTVLIAFVAILARRVFNIELEAEELADVVDGLIAILAFVPGIVSWYVARKKAKA